MEKDILQDIIAHKREEIARQQEAVSLAQLSRLVENLPEGRSMKQALNDSPHGIIAEFKRHSPSKDGSIRKPMPQLSRLHMKRPELQPFPS